MVNFRALKSRSANVSGAAGIPYFVTYSVFLSGTGIVISNQLIKQVKSSVKLHIITYTSSLAKYPLPV